MSASSPFLLLHITGAIAALLAGTMAVVFRKGSAWHNAAGNVFFVAMLGMTSSAAVMAVFLRPNRLNLQVAVFTCYLVCTAWVAAKRRDGGVSLFDRIALMFVLADGLAGLTWCFMAVNSPTKKLDHMPAAPFFIFGTIALLCAWKDVRMLAAGGVTGSRRIARHLWRMCLALLITGLSFYPGQAKLFPAAWRETNLLIVPQILLLGFMVMALYRISRRARTAPVILSRADGEGPPAAYGQAAYGHGVLRRAAAQDDRAALPAR